MTDNFEAITGFNRPRPTEDAYIAGLYDELGLGEAPTLGDIEPHALEMMRDRRVLEGMGLVLGRRIDAQDVQADQGLRDITLMAIREPEHAFGGLLLKLTLEELASER